MRRRKQDGPTTTHPPQRPISWGRARLERDRPRSGKAMQRDLDERKRERAEIEKDRAFGGTREERLHHEREMARRKEALNAWKKQSS